MNEKLEKRGISPYISWLGNRKLDIQFMDNVAWIITTKSLINTAGSGVIQLYNKLYKSNMIKDSAPCSPKSCYMVTLTWCGKRCY